MKTNMTAVLVLLLASTGWSRGADIQPAQFNHRAYTAAEGAPIAGSSLVQTSDGTLWIGSQTGLYRFDGVKFTRYPEASDPPLLSNNIATLTASADGGLWIGYRLGGVSELKAGRLMNYAAHSDVPDGSIRQFAWDRHGVLWVATSSGVARFKGHWERVLDVPARSIIFDREDHLWVATAESVRARVGDQLRQIYNAATPLNWSPYLILSPLGEIWFGNQRGTLVRIRSVNDARPATYRVAEADITPMLFDSQGNLWMAIGDTIVRRPGPERMFTSASSDVVTEQFKFTKADGLSGEPTALFEDREGNIWAATANGLDRFSRSNVLRAKLPDCPGGIGYALAADSGGRLWGACTNYDSTGGILAELSNGIVVAQRATGPYTASYQDADGTVWFGGPQGFGPLENGQVAATPLPANLAGFDIQALARDAKGAMWMSVVRKGVFRFHDGEWTPYGGLDAMPRGAAIVITAGSNGDLWFGYPDGRIALVQDDTVHVYDASTGLNVGAVTAIFMGERQIWVGGEFGLARFDGGHFLPVLTGPEKAFEGVSGIITTENGDLWLNGSNGVSRIPRHELQQMLADPSYRVSFDSFDRLDGVRGVAEQLRPTPSARRTTDGRVWFSFFHSHGELVSIDPRHLVRNAVVPPVTIWSLTAAGHRYSDITADLRLPIHTQNVMINYSAGSLTVPERVRFRYRLEGYDSDWRDVGARREAMYTNLSPGNYSFRVIAANNDGVWNTSGATLHFAIEPAFYQTKWFYVLCAMTFVAALALLYQLRIAQVRAQVRGYIEARLGERERIARELHDTLLQAVQGLIWRFQAATDRIPAGEPARNLMEQSLERADRVLAESRDKVKNLRALDTPIDLIEALLAEGHQFATTHQAAFRASTEGAPRALHPIIREEILLVAREALSNAFRHSRAKHIEAQIVYESAALRVRIRDDGQGVRTDIIEEGGAPGHFGLLNMRERAEKIGAHLDIWSKLDAGTEVELCVPGRVAYSDRKSVAGRSRLWQRIYHSSPDK